ncbi:MogA/MoaB family molybdenum cofactor biosynthesis protein [SAR202 cluster bacterium AC-647-N09_OGT_505m]|nr:MogA/MoaB family molybdenum cofactor biosynthesis protein [SAR202 cluster bacterium AC-647-N09_OGT_505m]
MFTLGVLTSSDMGAAGQREDTSGQAIKEIFLALGFSLSRYEIVPDEKEIISTRLREWADSGEIDLIVTTGGTGLGPRDVTPEATLDVIQRPVPGISEALRQSGLSHTPMAMLSRGISGLRGRCLIINLPGSPRAVRECLETVVEAIPHALETLKKARVEIHPPH